LLTDRRLGRVEFAGNRRKAPRFDNPHKALHALEAIHGFIYSKYE